MSSIYIWRNYWRHGQLVQKGVYGSKEGKEGIWSKAEMVTSRSETLLVVHKPILLLSFTSEFHFIS